MMGSVARRVIGRCGIGRSIGGLAAAAVVASAVAMPTAEAQVSAIPDSFNAQLAGSGLLIEVSAPAALPLDVLAGIAYAQVGVNSQPRIQSTAAPTYVPLVQDAALLGGTSGVLGIAIRLAPGLVVGLPTLFGLDPLPVDPSIVPVDPFADAAGSLPLPGAPPLGCTSYFPDEPREAECGGGAQEFFGFRVGAASARTTSAGDLDDLSKLASRSDASAVGISPGEFNPYLPVTSGSMAATALSRVADGRVVAQASSGAFELDIAGALQIEQVEARFSGAVDGTVENLQEQIECNIVGAQSSGEEVELGTDAVTLGGDDFPIPTEIASQLNGVLAQLGGQVGPADFGFIQVTPNPAPVSEVSEDGTSIRHRFGCLEVRYRNITSGTDVKLTFGSLAVSMSAFRDEPVSFDDGSSGFGSSPSSSSTGLDSDGLIGSLGGVVTGPARPELPDAPAPGSGAPRPSIEPFLRTSIPVGWGIDGGWLAPFCLLALAVPLLAIGRRMTVLDPRS